jgi:hypothetical protein
MSRTQTRWSASPKRSGEPMELAQSRGLGIGIPSERGGTSSISGRLLNAATTPYSRRCARQEAY